MRTAAAAPMTPPATLAGSALTEGPPRERIYAIDGDKHDGVLFYLVQGLSNRHYLKGSRKGEDEFKVPYKTAWFDNSDKLEFARGSILSPGRGAGVEPYAFEGDFEAACMRDGLNEPLEVQLDSEYRLTEQSVAAIVDRLSDELVDLIPERYAHLRSPEVGPEPTAPAAAAVAMPTTPMESAPNGRAQCSHRAQATDTPVDSCVEEYPDTYMMLDLEAGLASKD